MKHINIKLPDNNNKQIKYYSTGYDLLKTISKTLHKKTIAIIINDKIHDLNDALPNNCKIKFLTTDNKETNHILNHSCEHIMAAAINKLFHNVKFVTGQKKHNLNFYYDMNMPFSVTKKHLIHIKQEMQNMINNNIIFKKILIQKKYAKLLFKKLQQPYKIKILSSINANYISLYALDNFVDLCHGPHIPHTGFIKAFKLESNYSVYYKSNNKHILQRITGSAFFSHQLLQQYIQNIEKQKKRDHRILNKQLKLYTTTKQKSYQAISQSQKPYIIINATINRNDNISSLLEQQSHICKDIINIINDANIKHINFNEIKTNNKIDNYINIKIFAHCITKIQKKQIFLIENKFNKHNKNNKTKITLQNKYSEEIGSGLITWLPNGAQLKQLIENIITQINYKHNYQFISSPHIAKNDLWKISGHWQFYQQNMFSSIHIHNQEYQLKPMNCPFHILAYKNAIRSYKHLPIKFAEFGTVYRYENISVIHGLMRTRGFTQDDAHIFCDFNNVETEITHTLQLTLNILKMFQFNNFQILVSTCPDKFIGNIQQWKISENILKKSITNLGLSFSIDNGNGSFYGPKIDVQLQDSMNRIWQCSTIQLDLNSAKNFNITFKQYNNKLEHPVIIHRAILGSVERFIGILIEELNGNLPVWLSPEQVRILNISKHNIKYCNIIKNIIYKTGIRVGHNFANETLEYKIKKSQIEKIPIMIIIGNKEEELNKVTIRLRSDNNQQLLSITKMIEFLKQQSKTPLFDII